MEFLAEPRWLTETIDHEFKEKMIEFSLFRFPVRVHWSFWLLAFFLGGGFYARDPDDWTRVLVAIGVIFVSILVHELGHAFAGRHYRARPVFAGFCNRVAESGQACHGVLASFSL